MDENKPVEETVKQGPISTFCYKWCPRTIMTLGVCALVAFIFNAIYGIVHRLWDFRLEQVAQGKDWAQQSSVFFWHDTLRNIRNTLYTPAENLYALLCLICILLIIMCLVLRLVKARI